MSGIDHYEIGIVDKKASSEASPSFVQAESPFLLPLHTSQGSRLIVRAFDRAGNVRDISMNVTIPFAFMGLIKNNLVIILLILLILIILILIFHYLIGHHVIRHLRQALKLIHEEEMTYGPARPVASSQIQPVYIAQRPEIPVYLPSEDSPFHR
jgi:hypothetical protein